MAGKFEIKKSTNGQFMFNLKAGNHEVILTSELYHEKQSAMNGVESVRANASDDGRYERKTAKNGSPFFVLKAANGEVITFSMAVNEEYISLLPMNLHFGGVACGGLRLEGCRKSFSENVSIFSFSSPICVRRLTARPCV